MWEAAVKNRHAIDICESLLGPYWNTAAGQRLFYFGTHLSIPLGIRTCKLLKGSPYRQNTHLFYSHSPFPMFYSLRNPKQPRRPYNFLLWDKCAGAHVAAPSVCSGCCHCLLNSKMAGARSCSTHPPLLAAESPKSCGTEQAVSILQFLCIYNIFSIASCCSELTNYH